MDSSRSDDHLALVSINSAWIFVTSPYVKDNVRAANRAVELAERAVKLKPQNGQFLNTLGIVQLRVARYSEAVESFTRSAELLAGEYAGDDAAYNLFGLAMAHWQLGDKEKSRGYFEKAVEWTQKNQPTNEELVRFRAEAEEMLGITADTSKPPLTTTKAQE
jgi:Tfp pilus assembly protein PilF